MKTISFDVLVERQPGPELLYSACCPALPGCYASGVSVETAQARMVRAIRVQLEAQLASDSVIPVTTVPGQSVGVKAITLLLK
jgi:predicted RNase H-like HicB family nuclease